MRPHDEGSLAFPSSMQELTAQLIGAIGAVGVPVADLLCRDAALEISAGLQQCWAWWNWSTGHPTYQVVSMGAAALPPCRVGQAQLGTASIALCAAIGAW